MAQGNLLKSSMIYTLVNLLNKGIPFLLLPILTFYLSPGEYGIVTLFTLYLGLLTPFIGFNIHGAIARVYFQKDINFSEYISTAHLVVLLSTVLSTVIVINIYFLTSILDEINLVYILAGILAAFGNYITQLLLTIWQVTNHPIKYGLIQIFKTIINFSVSILLVVVINYGSDGRILGIVIGSLAALIFSYRHLIKYYEFKIIFNKKYLIDMLYFGIPLIPHLMSLYLVSSIDKIFIAETINENAMGIYAVAYQIALILFVLSESFNVAWNPYLYKKLSTKDYKGVLKNIFIYISILSVIGLLLALITPLIYNIFINEQYISGMKYVYILIVAFIINGIYKILASFIFFIKKTYIISIISIITAVFNIVIVYYLINVYGVIGAPIAMLITYTISLVLIIIVIFKNIKMIKEF